jgi:hypothetical protein
MGGKREHHTTFAAKGDFDKKSTEKPSSAS